MTIPEKADGASELAGDLTSHQERRQPRHSGPPTCPPRLPGLRRPAASLGHTCFSPLCPHPSQLGAVPAQGCVQPLPSCEGNILRSTAPRLRTQKSRSQNTRCGRGRPEGPVKTRALRPQAPWREPGRGQQRPLVDLPGSAAPFPSVLRRLWGACPAPSAGLPRAWEVFMPCRYRACLLPACSLPLNPFEAGGPVVEQTGEGKRLRRLHLWEQTREAGVRGREQGGQVHTGGGRAVAGTSSFFRHWRPPVSSCC